MHLPRIAPYVARPGTTAPIFRVAASVRELDAMQKIKLAMILKGSKAPLGTCPGQRTCLGTGRHQYEYECCDNNDRCGVDRYGNPFCEGALRQAINDSTPLPAVLNDMVIDYILP